jgi:hypothetical protein
MEGVWYKVALFLSALAVLAVLHASTRYQPSHSDHQSSFVEHARKGPDEHLMEDEDDGNSETNKEEELSDDITFLFAIIDMNRRTHMGIENYTFEKDYLEEVKKFLHTYRPEKMQIIIQRKYRPHIEELLYEGVHVRYVEVEDLRAWRYYEPIERIRTSDWWTKNTGWLPEVPQGYSDLYNPIVMHKLLWLRDLSVLNPFKTKYFVWLDSGGICTPRIRNDIMPIPDFKVKAKAYMDKFLISVTQYAMGNELHGCYREAMLKLTYDQSPCYIAKGWLMGGQREYLEKVSRLYEYILNTTLELGCLGTEETLLTMAYYRRPDLFHVHHNVEDRSDAFPQSDDVCYFVWERVPAKGVVETPLEYYERTGKFWDDPSRRDL